MGYADSFSVDELIDQKARFVNKNVLVNGELVKYEMGPGFFIWQLALTLKGEKYAIVAKCKISRLHREHKLLLPHLNGYLGEVIGVKIRADNHGIMSMKFGDREFNVLS